MEMDTNAVIGLIRDSKKKTTTRAFISGDFAGVDWAVFDGINAIAGREFATATGEYDALLGMIETLGERVASYDIEPPRARNSAIPMADLTRYDARIEPGAIIREMVAIGKGVVVMMGAVVNIGAVIGEETMIDMNAVLGGRACIGSRCHIGAGAVIAGVVEPASAEPTRIEDRVFVGANAVILEGVRVGQGAVVAAGAVVTQDVPPGAVVAGSPARVIKMADDSTASKTALVDDLRQR